MSNKQKDVKKIKVKVPMREKKTFVLDTLGMTVEKWEKIGEKEFEVEEGRISPEDINKIENAPDCLWWGITQLPRQTPFGIEQVPFTFEVNGETLEEVAGNYESRLHEAIEELKKEIAKSQNQIQPASAEDLNILEKAAKQTSGGIIY